jgi:hypothetical protein
MKFIFIVLDEQRVPVDLVEVAPLSQSLIGKLSKLQ